MPKIFISHSRYDEDIRNFFDILFAGSTVKAVRFEFEYEYEKYKEPPSSYIMRQIETSDAIFVLLGSNITRSPFTQSWVAFEIGLAAASQYAKHIWVFEPIEYSPIEFPVPFLHHYVPYGLHDDQDRKYVNQIIRAYEPIPLFRRIPPGFMQVVCPYENCKATYILHKKLKSFYCPVCRKPLEFRE